MLDCPVGENSRVGLAIPEAKPTGHLLEDVGEICVVRDLDAEYVLEVRRQLLALGVGSIVLPNVLQHCIRGAADCRAIGILGGRQV